MALSRNFIHRGLATELQANFSEPTRIVWENTFKSSDANEPWLEEIFLPTDTLPTTAMRDGYTRDFGIYQINVYIPTGKGTIISDNYIDELSQIFKTGVEIIKDGELIIIDRSTPTQGFIVDNWYVVPFSVYWTCDMKVN